MTRTVIIPAQRHIIERAGDELCYTTDERGDLVSSCPRSVRLPDGYFCDIPGFTCSIHGKRGIRCKASEVKDE